MVSHKVSVGRCSCVDNVKVGLQRRPLEKRVLFPLATLSGFLHNLLGYDIRWYALAVSFPPGTGGWGCFMCTTVKKERRLTGRAGLRSAGLGWGWGVVDGKWGKCLHCTARTATDPEIAGV